MPTNDPILEVKDLRTWFPIRRGVMARTVGHVRAVDGVDIHIQRGETLGLVGESGCGKTTLARAVLRLDPVRTGSIRFDGRELVGMRESAMRPLRRHMQVVFQDPFSSLNPRMTVLGIVTEGLVQHAIITAREREEHGIRLLEDVGLGREALHRFPHEFSGGQRQRISIARAVSVNPRLVICDEAVSALDVSVQAQVLNLLMDLRDKYGLSYLFISHDLSAVRHISDRVAVMYLGRIVEAGPTETVIRDPRHPYTQALLSAVPRAGAQRVKRVVLAGDVPSPSRPPQGCRFHPRCPYAGDDCRRTEPRLEGCDPQPRETACIRQADIPTARQE